MAVLSVAGPPDPVPPSATHGRWCSFAASAAADTPNACSHGVTKRRKLGPSHLVHRSRLVVEPEAFSTESERLNTKPETT